MKWAISLAVGLGLIYLGWKVPFVLTAVHVLICFLLVIVVLMQSGKAADLAGAFGGAGSQTAFGPRGAATILSKATTWCFIMFLLTTVTLTLQQSVQRPQGKSLLEKTGSSAPPKPAGAPAGQASPAPSAPAKK
jgi:preprotein translocase subunit SecG